MPSRRFSVSRVLLALPLAVALLAAAPSSAHSAKLAVVDVQRVLSEARATASIQEQLGKQRTAYQAEISKLEQDLKAAEAQLEKEQQAKKPSGDLIQKKADFEKRVVESRQLVQQRRAGLEKGASDALDSVRDEMVKIISEIASKDKYDAVLARQAVIVSAPSLDITDAVLKSLNSRMSKVTVKFDGN